MVAPPAMNHFCFSGKVTSIVQNGEYLEITVDTGKRDVKMWLSNVEICDLPKWVKVGESVEFDSETMRITKA